jgi:hypothetical protein
MIAQRIEWFSEYEILMAGAEPKPTANLAQPNKEPEKQGNVLKVQQNLEPGS